MLFDGHDLSALAPEDRARAGVFLAFQYPVEIPGVANNQFCDWLITPSGDSVARKSWILSSLMILCGKNEAAKDESGFS